jgi:hypothetical protein
MVSDETMLIQARTSMLMVSDESVLIQARTSMLMISDETMMIQARTSSLQLRQEHPLYRRTHVALNKLFYPFDTDHLNKF